ncbi:MAG: preprotein translocase subunit SecE [Pseudomonadota bacterium]
MVKTGEQTSSVLDTAMWLFAFIVMGSAVAGFYYFADYSLLLRVVSLLAAAGIAFFIAAQTSRGRAAVGFVREAQLEVRKMVWPTRQETLQTTGIVIIMVLILSTMIWIIDSILFWIVQTLTN